MAYNYLVTFMKKISRLLYKDELTPVVMDYLLERKMAEDQSLAYILKLDPMTVK